MPRQIRWQNPHVPSEKVRSGMKERVREVLEKERRGAFCSMKLNPKQNKTKFWHQLLISQSDQSFRPNFSLRPPGARTSKAPS